MFFFENLNRFKKYYKNILTSKIEVNPKINFGSAVANLYFFTCLNNSKYYFEYGSGSSTLVANKNKKNFKSIELDKKYFDNLKKKIRKKKNLEYINIGPVGDFSYPLLKNKNKIKKYIQSIDKEFQNEKFPDFILIDGRFRVACALNLLKFTQVKKNLCKIIIDDYRNRKEYHILEKFFFINKIGRFGILKINKIFSKEYLSKEIEKNLLISK